MSKQILGVIGACTAVISLTAVCFFSTSVPNDVPLVIAIDGVSRSSTTVMHSRIPIQAEAFLDIGSFERAQGVQPIVLPGRVVAGVVNHHVLASDLLQRFFVSLGQARPDATRIIIISPDHYKRGESSISVGTVSYMARSRTVSIDMQAVERLREAGVARGDRELFEREHGIGALIPFLVNAFPDATIVPLVVRADISDQDARSFGRTIADIVDDTTLVIVSSDMSHYLSEKNALRNDARTLTWLETLNSKQMSNATDDFTDNSSAFEMLFSMFETAKMKPSFHLIDQSISTMYGGDRRNTTSYINGVWTISNTKNLEASRGERLR